MNAAPSSALTPAAATNALSRLAADQRGAATVEYIIIAGMIAIACMAAFQRFGDQVFQRVEAQGQQIGNVIDTPR